MVETSPRAAAVTVLIEPFTLEKCEVQLITPLALESLVLH